MTLASGMFDSHIIVSMYVLKHFSWQCFIKDHIVNWYLNVKLTDYKLESVLKNGLYDKLYLN